MAVITISRQYGSGGDEIATRLCEVLRYRYFDKRLMTQVATEAGLSPSEVTDFSEDNYKVHSFLERLFGRHSLHTFIQSGSLPGGIETRNNLFVPGMGLFPNEVPARPRFVEVEEPDEMTNLTFIQAVIRAAYKHGNMVIVGRGGQALLRDKADVLHIRLVASLDARVQRLHTQENYSLGGAQDYVVKRDRASAEYLRRFYDLDWADPVLYDLVINTTRLDLEAATQLVIKALERLPVAQPA